MCPKPYERKNETYCLPKDDNSEITKKNLHDGKASELDLKSHLVPTSPVDGVEPPDSFISVPT